MPHSRNVDWSGNISVGSLFLLAIAAQGGPPGTVDLPYIRPCIVHMSLTCPGHVPQLPTYEKPRFWACIELVTWRALRRCLIANIYALNRPCLHPQISSALDRLE